LREALVSSGLSIRPVWVGPGGPDRSGCTQDQITFPATGAVITAIASDYAGAAGGNPTIWSFDEIAGLLLHIRTQPAALG